LGNIASAYGSVKIQAIGAIIDTVENKYFNDGKNNKTIFIGIYFGVNMFRLFERI